MRKVSEKTKIVLGRHDAWAATRFALKRLNTVEARRDVNGGKNMPLPTKLLFELPTEKPVLKSLMTFLVVAEIPFSLR